MLFGSPGSGVALKILDFDPGELNPCVHAIEHRVSAALRLGLQLPGQAAAAKSPCAREPMENPDFAACS
jgi:hypothetical protein